jgi:1-acyl-sn-glycerol-3-phosphate acyltransferase
MLVARNWRGDVATDPSSDRADRVRMRTALAGLSPRQGPLDGLVRVVVRLGFAILGWRVQASGLGRLPCDDRGRVVPCVVAVAPHRGWIDPFLLLLAWPGSAPRLAWFGDERTMVRSWWRRRLLPHLGMIPIPPRATPGAVRDHLADARIVLGQGCCLVVFPEKGPPSPRGRTRTIAPGAAWLAAAGDVPLVPVAIGGFLETGLGTRFALRVLAPLPAPTASPDTAGGIRAARETTDQLRADLAPAVAELEDWSARVNRTRPLPGLRRLFR